MVSNKNSIKEVSNFKTHIHNAMSGVFSPDQSIAAIGTESGELILVDLYEKNVFHLYEGKSGWINSISISPDNSYVLTGGTDGKVWLWDIKKKKGLLIFSVGSGYLYVNISRDGRYILIVSIKSIHLLNAETHKEELSITIPYKILRLYGYTNSMALSGDNRLFLLGSNIRSFYLLDLTNVKTIHEFLVPQGRVWSLKFSPDNKYILSGSGDINLSGDWKDNGAVCMWEVQNGAKVWSNEDYEFPVMSVDFSPDGKHCLIYQGNFSNREIGYLKLIETKNGSETSTIELKNELVAIKYSYDSQRALTINKEGLIQEWSLPIQ